MRKRNNSNRVSPVKMHDVAKLAGVSQSTVSRVLSKSSSVVPISEKTVRRVQEAVDQLGYYPNLTARSLRAQQTNMIAIMIADISNAFYHYIVRTVQDIAHQHHYDVLIANTDHVYDNEKHFCEAMMRRPVDGAIMVVYHLQDEDLDLLIKRTGSAVVTLSNDITHPMVDRVYSEDGKAFYETTKWRIDEKHHERIGYIGVSTSYKLTQRRFE